MDASEFTEKVPRQNHVILYLIIQKGERDQGRITLISLGAYFVLEKLYPYSEILIQNRDSLFFTQRAIISVNDKLLIRV